MKVFIAITLFLSTVAFGHETVEVRKVKPVCEQKLIKEKNRVAIIYVPRGCEYGPWANINEKKGGKDKNKK